MSPAPKSGPKRKPGRPRKARVGAQAPAEATPAPATSPSSPSSPAPSPSTLRAAAASAGHDPATLFPSVWAERNCRLPHLATREPVPYSTADFPWMRDVLDDFSERIVVEKPAQFGFTQGAGLIKAFHRNIVDRSSVLYCLPTNEGASKFSAARFDPMINLSPAVRAAYSDVSNVGHKRAGNANLWIRGMNSEDALKEVDPALLVRDEFDEMDPVRIGLSGERVSGQLERQILDLSTPTFPDRGIDAEYKSSDQKRWMARCPRPRCSGEVGPGGAGSGLVFLDWPTVKWDEAGGGAGGASDLETIAATAFIECPSCHAPWSEIERAAASRAGRWIARYRNKGKSGYRMTRAYSLVLPLAKIVLKYLEARYHPGRLQHVMNAFGLPFVADGLQLTPELVACCVRDYGQQQSATEGNAPAAFGAITMGVDVGSLLHYRISAPREDKRDPKGFGRRVLRVGTVKEFEELDALMRAFGVSTCVIDANPERRKAKEFQDRWGGPAAGRVWLALYPGDPRDLVRWDEGTDAASRGFVLIHRTEAMDLTLARFRYPKDDGARGPNGESAPLPHGTIDLPRGLPNDFASQMCAPVRVIETRANGTQVAVYREGSSADHFAHCSLYDEVAALRGAGIGAGGSNEPATHGQEAAESGRTLGIGFGRHDDRAQRASARNGEADSDAGQERDYGTRGTLLGRRGLWS